MPAGVGAAIAQPHRTVFTIAGDGDFLMGATAVWTAVRYKLPLLLVVDDAELEARLAEAGLRPVRRHSSVWAALCSHARWLKLMGTPPTAVAA